MGQARSKVVEQQLGKAPPLQRASSGQLEPLVLSVIIPALNESVNIGAALSSVRSAAVPPLEILVVDGGSTDDTVAQAQRLGAQVVPSPRGRGRQLNAGWRAARGEWCLFLHSDSQLPPEYDRLISEALLTAAVRQGSLGAVRRGGGGWAAKWTGANFFVDRAPCALSHRADEVVCVSDGGGVAGVAAGRRGNGATASSVKGDVGFSTCVARSGSSCCGLGVDNVAYRSCRTRTSSLVCGPTRASKRHWAGPGCCAAAKAEASAGTGIGVSGAVAPDTDEPARQRYSSYAGDLAATAAGSQPSQAPGGARAAAVRAASSASGGQGGVLGAEGDTGSGAGSDFARGREGVPGRSELQPREPTWGAFATIEAELRNPILRTLLSTAVELRTRMLHRPYGDQALFVRRDVLQACGGFVEWPLLEDLDLVVRLGKETRPAIVDAPIRTSARRWQTVGFLRTTIINQVVLVGYALGMSPDTLAFWYTSAKRAMA